MGDYQPLVVLRYTVGGVVVNGIDVYRYDPVLSNEQMETFDVEPLKNLDDFDFDVDSFIFYSSSR